MCMILTSDPYKPRNRHSGGMDESQGCLSGQGTPAVSGDVLPYSAHVAAVQCTTYCIVLHSCWFGWTWLVLSTALTYISRAINVSLKALGFAISQLEGEVF